MWECAGERITYTELNLHKHRETWAQERCSCMLVRVRISNNSFEPQVRTNWEIKAGVNPHREDIHHHTNVDGCLEWPTHTHTHTAICHLLTRTITHNHWTTHLPIKKLPPSVSCMRVCMWTMGSHSDHMVYS